MRLLVHSGYNVTVVAWHCDVTTYGAASQGLSLLRVAITGNIVDNGYWGATACLVHCFRCTLTRDISVSLSFVLAPVVVLVFLFSQLCLRVCYDAVKNRKPSRYCGNDLRRSKRINSRCVINYYVKFTIACAQPSFAYLINTRGKYKDTYVILHVKNLILLLFTEDIFWTWYT